MALLPVRHPSGSVSSVGICFDRAFLAHLAIVAHMVLSDVDMVAPVAPGVIAVAAELLLQAHASGDHYLFFAMVADFTWLWPLILVEAPR